MLVHFDNLTVNILTV